MRRVVRRLLVGMFVVFLGIVAAFAYFLYAPSPELPARSAVTRRDSLRVGQQLRRYVVYVPARSLSRPPLLLALHGSMGNADQIRRASAYRFEQLADEHGFIVAYPEGYEGNWNDCRKQGASSAKQLRVDDVGFIRALVAHFRAENDIDSARVFAAGLSNGAHIAYRLALEAPDLVRGIAAIAANLPTEDNYDCTPVPGATSVLIVNGTEDPINPFEGGRVTVFGFGDRGKVRSARESAAYFAQRNGITDGPVAERLPPSGTGLTSVERLQWRSANGADVILYAIHGGGHTLPHPTARPPRILGPTHAGLDGPTEIWRFFSGLETRPLR